MQRQVHFADAMSRERFWQEAALTAFKIFVEAAERNGIAEKRPDDEALDVFIDSFAARVARVSFALADEMVRQHGPDAIPRVPRL